MKLSVFSDFALRVLMFAALKDGPFRVDEVTAAYGVSRNHVAKVVHHLAMLGYLRTRRGRGGGITLARPAGEISIGRLVRDTEGPPILVECFDPGANTCPVSGHCRLKGLLGAALNAFYESLDGHTVADLVQGPGSRKLARTLIGPRPPVRASGANSA